MEDMSLVGNPIYIPFDLKILMKPERTFVHIRQNESKVLSKYVCAGGFWYHAYK